MMLSHISNHSMSIATTTPTSDRLNQDPRSIAGDLKQAYVGEGPLRVLYLWQQLLKTWGLSGSGVHEADFGYIRTLVSAGFIELALKIFGYLHYDKMDFASIEKR